MSLAVVNPYSPHISDAESRALSAMLAKRESYVEQGRAREAHGAGTMIMLLWGCLHSFSDTDPTGFDQL